jgi:hypothetical protein
MKLTAAIMNNLGYSPAKKEEYLTELLDSEGSVTVAGMEYYPSDILKNCDPTAWRCMLSDLEYFTEIDGDDYTNDDCEAAQEELAELVEAVELAQEELDAAIEEATTESDALAIEEARSVLEQAKAALSAITGE